MDRFFLVEEPFFLGRDRLSSSGTGFVDQMNLLAAAYAYCHR